ncbi:MAG: DUF3822 family protein [Bacteroidetes bacterium]|nr:DUF3822 family protein [Bacteroidota bacterium]
MQTTTVNYKLIKKVKDDRFDEEQLHQCTLIIQTGAKDFQVAVIDQENRLMLLEDYSMGNVQSHTELMASLKELFDAHALLKAGFWKAVRIGVKSNKFCQLPASLFDPNKSEAYLRVNATIDKQKETVLNCKNKSSDIVTVFSVQEDFYQWICALYQNTTPSFFHQSASLIEGVLSRPKSNGHLLYLYVDRFKLHIISAQSGKLIYYNQFPIKQFQDYVKCIMLVMRGLNLDQQNSSVVLWGYIGKNSPHYQEFIKYIRKVDFGGRPGKIKFSYFFDEIQDHHFFDLFSLYLL